MTDPPAPSRTTPIDVLDAWLAHGPLVHQATAFKTLDGITGGGPVFGSRWYVLGAPDASKTLLLSLWADIWAIDGLTVGMLAVDEEPEDLMMRFIQRRPLSTDWHFHRAQCEARHPSDIESMRREMAGLRVLFYGPEFTIETAGADVFKVAKGGKCALMVDSVQTVECDAIRASRKDLEMRGRITENVRAIRSVATGYKMIVVATSEMNRSAYRSIVKADQNDMAAAKESGAIEYSARVMLAMRNVPDEEACIEVKVIKNKHGPSYPSAGPFYLAIDRARQVLRERDAPESLKEEGTVEASIRVVRENPTGITTEATAKAIGKRRTAVEAALESARASGAIRRLNGAKSPWVAVDTKSDLDPDTEFP